ncbi:response regulator [Pinibacter soli]|uniref:Response regulator n=1 Tax=Pinibacter soli TaxID=3044211 RepID=A0ABT6R8H2_9BACT|nr:response regulator [Pinibacter soli]MDI3318766.1 response regulator [Pinibacter soli]
MKTKLKCVMLIDDDEPTGFSNKMVVEEMNCSERIHVIPNAKLALEYVKTATNNSSDQCTPELIFLDINMPAMDGWEFLAEYEKLSQEQKSKAIVVMLTTSFNPEDRLRAMQIESVAAFRNKPLTTEILREILEEHFPDYL